MDVHCFLLTDMLLICKQTAKKAHGNLKVNFFFDEGQQHCEIIHENFSTGDSTTLHDRSIGDKT